VTKITFKKKNRTGGIWALRNKERSGTLNLTEEERGISLRKSLGVPKSDTRGRHRKR